MNSLLSVINEKIMTPLENVDNIDQENIRTLYFNEMKNLLKLDSQLDDREKTLKFFEYEVILNIIQNDFGVDFMTPNFYNYMFMFLNSLEELYRFCTKKEISFIINRDNVEVCLTSNLDNFNNLED